MNVKLKQYWNGEPCAEDTRVQLSIEDADDCIRISVQAPFYDDPPPLDPIGSTPQLWQYEVVEWFVVGQGTPVPYLEVELGPHGHHLALELRGIRTVVHTHQSLAYSASIQGDQWFGTALIPKAWLPAGPYTHNAFAIHGVGEHRKYLTLFPTGGTQPDFHRLHTFQSLELM